MQEKERNDMYQVYLPMSFNQAPIAAKCLGAGFSEGAHVQLGTNWHRSWGLYVGYWDNRIGVPCVWGALMINQAVYIGIGGNTPYVLGFNEPDMADQANMTPEEAAPLWHTLTQARPERLFASPSTIESDTWLPDFRNCYISMFGIPPRFDVIDIHCYADDPTADLARVDLACTYANTWGVNEVWISEFQYGHRQEEGATDRLVTFFDELRSRPLVKKVFWFAVNIHPAPWYPDDWLIPNLVTDEWELTELGEVYRDL